MILSFSGGTFLLLVCLPSRKETDTWCTNTQDAAWDFSSRTLGPSHRPVRVFWSLNGARLEGMSFSPPFKDAFFQLGFEEEWGQP